MDRVRNPAVSILPRSKFAINEYPIVMVKKTSCWFKKLFTKYLLYFLLTHVHKKIYTNYPKKTNVQKYRKILFALKNGLRSESFFTHHEMCQIVILNLILILSTKIFVNSLFFEHVLPGFTRFE